jgi:hypothetical protein
MRKAQSAVRAEEDSHPSFGKNVRLAERLSSPQPSQATIAWGSLPNPASAQTSRCFDSGAKHPRALPLPASEVVM